MTVMTNLESGFDRPEIRPCDFPFKKQTRYRPLPNNRFGLRTVGKLFLVTLYRYLLNSDELRTKLWVDRVF